MRIVGRADYQPLKLRALARALNVADEDYEAFCQAAGQLRHKGRVVIGSKSCISLPAMTNRVVGKFQATNRGFGFVLPATPTAQGDLFIPPGQSLDAITGDTVVARVVKRGGDMRHTGRVVEILERAETRFVGVLTQRDGQWFVQPDGRALTEPIAVDDPGAKDAQPDDKVLVEILSFPSANYYATGVIIERLGKSGVSKTELKATMRRFNLADKFSPKVLREARGVVQTFDAGKAVKQALREDIRQQTVITIDPVNARDFDDAISVRKLPQNRWLLGVHIADVAHFVESDGDLDQEAQQRGNSVYLPQHVIPMLPELLSNGVCSLQQGQDRFVKSAYIKLDQNGKVLGSRFANSVICSAQRLTYEQAEDILAGRGDHGDRCVVALLKKMERLARILQARRRKQGMLTLDLPKAELIFDKRGHVIDARPESDSFTHTIIEMFMLEANEAVARMLDSRNVPFLRRVHPEPDGLVMGDAARTLKLCGYVIPKNINRQGLQQLLASVRGKPASFVVNLAVLKSLQRAEYSPDPIGHYALASTHYGHFTSPIRRYPDLTIHRLLQAYLAGRLTAKTVRDFPDHTQLEELGRHCSDTERNAENAERELRTLKILQLLTKRIGEETMGIVTSVTNFGVFVQLEKFLIEGLMTAEDVQRHLASGRKGKRARSAGPRRQGGRERFMDTCPYKIGQELRVKIARINLPARTIDLVPI